MKTRILILTAAFTAASSFAVAQNVAQNGAQNGAQKTPAEESTRMDRLNDGAEFQRKLGIMFKKAEMSIKLLREQIIQNQSAPFLPDLYLQLADLLSEKSNILYYQQAEKEKSSELKLDSKQKLNPIVVTQQEAITIYQQILKEFPNFAKRDKVLYRLAISQKSIDETAAFVQTAETLLKAYPKAKETMQVRLLLGQFYYDQQEFKDASDVLKVVEASEFPYERNAARYRMGLIRINEEKFSEALALFEKVATDEQLKEEDNPLEVSINTRTVNSNIKREALIDSVRAYTEVFKRNADPIGYYNRVAPTEILFQEVIEKLAYRYIFLKNEHQAMSLLRVLSERVSDPQKIINFYQEVLLMIPPMERIEVPYEEMQFVLTKYNDWLNFFEIPAETRTESYKFFETQIREMGTKSHDLGKSEISATRKEVLYERAKNFYQLYLGFFNKGPNAVKIATNLADVYFYQKNFFRAGDFYLRISQGEFGKISNKEALLQNAILCFQKPAPSDFYEIVRNRGLLVKAIQSYMTLDPKKKNDPKLNFILVKSTYEQGLYAKALRSLLAFIAKYPQAVNEAESATDIGLDYYNIRSDFKGLVNWSTRVLAINSISPDLRKRLEGVKSKALLKEIDEQVKGKANYDAFAQGKIYFETALNMQDESMKSVILEQALARSKSEKDIQTFLKAAKAIANAEKDSEKRASILLGMGEQTLAIGGFYETLNIWKQIMTDARTPERVKKQVREKSLRLALMLKDWSKILEYSQGADISDTLKQNSYAHLGQHITSAAAVSNQLISSVPLRRLSADELVPFFKGYPRVNPEIQKQILSASAARCASQKNSIICRWNLARAVPGKVNAFRQQMGTSPATLQGVEPAALKLNALLTELRSTEETGDPVLDVFTSLYKAKIFSYFAQYLKKVGVANPEVAEILSTKASESMQNAKAEYKQCARIISASSLVSPINRFCTANKEPSLSEALTWSQTVKVGGVSADPKGPEIHELQKKIFVEPKNGVAYLELAEKYLEKRQYNHAVALSSYSISTFPEAKEDFESIMGCGLLELGLYNEAVFHLKAGSDHRGLKEECSKKLKARTE